MLWLKNSKTNKLPTKGALLLTHIKKSQVSTIADFPLLLPGVVKTYTGISNKLVDQSTRLIETKKCIKNILESGWFKKIVVLDGSGVSVLNDSEIDAIKKTGVEIEQIIFNQNIVDVQLYGKSNGECQLIEYAVKNSRIINLHGGFYKLSPRYTLDNINDVMPVLQKNENVFFHYNIWPFTITSPFLQTIFYKTSLNFYQKFLYDAVNYCSNTKDGYLEAVYYKKIKELPATPLKCPFPHFSGVAGTTGQAIYNNKYFFRNIISNMGYLAFYY